MSDWMIRAFATERKINGGPPFGELLAQTEHEGDVDAELELIRLHDRRDIAFVDQVNCKDHQTTRLYRDGNGGWSPVRTRAW